MTHFFLGFICSIGCYVLFYKLNRPARKLWSIPLLFVAILGYPLCELWTSKNLQQFDSVHDSIGYALYLIWLLACILLGTNRSRTLVAAAFLLCFGYIVQVPFGFLIGYVAFPSDTTSHFLKIISQYPKIRYTLLFFVNCSITGCCFLIVHWLRKIQANPPFKLSMLFSLALIIVTAINQVWWVYTITVMNDIHLVIFAFLGLLLTALPFFIMYLFTRFSAHTENTPGVVQAADDSPQTNISSNEYTQLVQRLSNRELEVVEAILAGKKRYKEIADKLNISVNTIKFHLKNIYRVTGVSNTSALLFLFRGYTSNFSKPEELP